MSPGESIETHDRPPWRPVRRWPALLLGMIVGAGIAVGVMLALWNRPLPFGDNGHDGHGRGHGEPVEISHTPTDEEVLDYLDGKTVTLTVKDVNEKPKTVTLRRANLSDLKWTGAGQITGLENPWNHSYVCLYSDETGSYILDLRIPVRVVGSRRIFLPLESAKVTPVDKVFTPPAKK